MDPVKVPKPVYEAYQSLFKEFNILSSKERMLLCMAIPSSICTGPAVILKEFALKNPFEYKQAVLYGCQPYLSVREELAKMLNEWLDKPYVEDERKDIQDFADTIVSYIQKQT